MFSRSQTTRWPFGGREPAGDCINSRTNVPSIHVFLYGGCNRPAPLSPLTALVDVQASGLCHTDLLFATHDIVPVPAVLGHEVAGIVAEVGPDVAQFHV